MVDIDLFLAPSILLMKSPSFLSLLSVSLFRGVLVINFLPILAEMVKRADLTMGKMANPGTGLYISLKVRNLERLCPKLKGRTVIRKYEGGVPSSN